jgi:ankyrin repeat protein
MSPDLADNNGNTLLHIASQNDQLKIAKLLLQYGADPSVCNHQGYLPVYFAKKFCYNSMELLLLSSGGGE